MADDLALSLVETTIQHFSSQLKVVDQAIAETIDNDLELSAKRDLLVSINGVGEALAGIVLAELPGPDILGCSAAVAAYAGLNPQQNQSGISVSRPVRISKIGKHNQDVILDRMRPSWRTRRVNRITALSGSIS